LAVNLHWCNRYLCKIYVLTATRFNEHPFAPLPLLVSETVCVTAAVLPMLGFEAPFVGDNVNTLLLQFLFEVESQKSNAGLKAVVLNVPAENVADV